MQTAKKNKWLSALLLTIKSFSYSFLLASFVFVLAVSLLCSLAVKPLVGRLVEVKQLFETTSHRSSLGLSLELFGGLLYGQYQEFPSRRWLILGTDQITGSYRENILTDTIILVSYNQDADKISLISFPRDIYLPTYGHKINQLYELGLAENPARPSSLIQTAVEEMIGQKIESVLVLSLSDLQNLIDRQGGVFVDIENSFTDERFPRAGVDVTTETDPARLYETISFEKGPQVLSGEQAIKFIRSRYANEMVEQGDLARQRRQQKVFLGLANQLLSPLVIADPVKVGLLYDWYSNVIVSHISLFEVGWFGSNLTANYPKFNQVYIPVSDEPVATEEATLFVHPPIKKYQQWAYETVDPSWNKMREFIIDNDI